MPLMIYNTHTKTWLDSEKNSGVHPLLPAAHASILRKHIHDEARIKNS